MNGLAFYEVSAQVIPVFIIAFALQTRLAAVSEATYFSDKIAEKLGQYPINVIKIIKAVLLLTSVAEVASLVVIFFGDAPWPVSLLVWPGLLSIIYFLSTELSHTVEHNIEMAVLRIRQREGQDDLSNR